MTRSMQLYLAVALVSMAAVVPVFAQSKPDPIGYKLCKQNPHCAVVKGGQDESQRKQVEDEIRRARLQHGR